MNKEYGTNSQAWRTKVSDVDEKGRVKIAVNAFNNEDTDGDISVPGSFKKTLSEHFSRVKWFLNHDKRILLGVPISGREENDQLVMEAQFNMNKEISRDTYTDYKLYAEHGKTLEHSIGVDVIKRDPIDKRKVTEWKLWEFSTLTAWGANSETPLLDIKDSSLTIEQLSEKISFLEKAIKEDYSKDKLNQIEQSITSLQMFIKKGIEDGEIMVACPSCGEIIDYNSQNEHTFESEVLETAGQYARWIVDGIVYDEMQKLKPEIREQVVAIIEANKSLEDEYKTKGIENFINYIRCPKCYSRVYKSCRKKPDLSTSKNAGESTFSLKSISSLLLNK